MDHAYIEEHQIADRYVLGTLPAAEAESFEDHYLSCPECLDRLELAESMQRGFQRAARQEAAKLQATRQLALVAWLARLSRGRQMAVLFNVLAVLVVLAVLPAGLARRDLAQARAALEQERQRSAAAGKLRQELAAREYDLAGEREARAKAAAQLAQAQQPQGNVPILVLDAERGGPSGGTSQRVRSPGAGGWIVLQAVIDPPYPAPRAYAAVLRDAHDRELWRRADLQMGENQTLNLSFPASLVPPGDYTLAVEGLTSGRQPTALRRFAFRVLPSG
jgi:hypothetical protein